MQHKPAQYQCTINELGKVSKLICIQPIRK